MSNEFEHIANPDSTPGAVSTGYQAQNVRMLADSNGLDLSVVIGGTGKVTVKQSGPVDVNGVLYSCKADTDLALSVSGWYYITLVGTGTTLTPTLVGVTANYAYLNAYRNAHYSVSTEYRILNWLIYYDGATGIAFRKGIDKPEHWITVAGTFVVPLSQVYHIDMCGKGGDGGTGATGYTGGGGGAAAWGYAKKYIAAGTTLTATFATSSGGNATLTDGVLLSLAVQNGYNGTNATGSANGSRGNPGSTSTGLDKTTSGFTTLLTTTYYGANSFFTNGYGIGGISGTSSIGGNGSGYGAGGGGGNNGAYAGGTGSGGFVKIVM